MWELVTDAVETLCIERRGIEGSQVELIVMAKRMAGKAMMDAKAKGCC